MPWLWMGEEYEKVFYFSIFGVSNHLDNFSRDITSMQKKKNLSKNLDIIEPLR